MLPLLFRRIMLAFESLIGEDTALVKDYECSALFNIFHSCLESAPQITLQMYIIITTWGDKGKQYLEQYIKCCEGKVSATLC